ICIPSFCEAVRLDTPIHDVPNLYYLDDDKKVVKTKLAPLCDINLSIPDFSLFDEERFIRPMGGKIFKSVPIETYRGCPFSCTYCNSPMQKYFALEDGLGSFLRRKKIPILRDELKKIDDLYSPDFFLFVDDSFLARPKREIFEFCDMYEEFKKPFWFNTRPENCSADVLKRLKEVGAYRISFGIECGNEQFRMKVLKRNISNKRLLKHFEDISVAGIAFSLNLIIGFPGETRDLVMDTIDLTRSIMGYDTLTVSIFTPYHGTHLRNIAIQNGWLDPNLITTHTTSSSILKMPAPYLSSQEIDGIMRVLPMYCYFPRHMWPEIKIAESDTPEGNEILERLSKIYTEDFLGMDQSTKMQMVTGTAGCAGDPKNSFLVSKIRFSDEELGALTKVV
ncbi:radical SAM protein, partial [bacterium]|nr:radical SAM protein [bacterium]